MGKWQFRSIDDMLERVVFNRFKKAIYYKIESNQSHIRMFQEKSCSSNSKRLKYIFFRLYARKE